MFINEDLISGFLMKTSLRDIRIPKPRDEQKSKEQMLDGLFESAYRYGGTNVYFITQADKARNFAKSLPEFLEISRKSITFANFHEF